MPARFSIIIPAYNEEELLPRLLRSIEVAKRNFTAGDVEVIVADNGSTDRTAEVARSLGATAVPVSQRRIAAARNGGASIASGDILCFIDADSAVHPSTFIAIDEAISAPTVVAGSTGLTLERVSLGIGLVYCLLVPFAWLLKIDSGVVFCRRSDFFAIGGYNEDLMVGEDVDFLMRLRRHGRGDGRRLIRLTDVRALGSTRKFDQHGDWHYFKFLPRILLALVRSGFDPVKSQAQVTDITDYWYHPGR